MKGVLGLPGKLYKGRRFHSLSQRWSDSCLCVEQESFQTQIMYLFPRRIRCCERMMMTIQYHFLPLPNMQPQCHKLFFCSTDCTSFFVSLMRLLSQGRAIVFKLSGLPISFLQLSFDV